MVFEIKSINKSFKMLIETNKKLLAIVRVLEYNFLSYYRTGLC